MNQFFQQTFALLTTPPGNLVYHLVVTFSIAGALLEAFNHWRTSQFPQAKRAILGLGILLALQVVMFAASGLAWLGFLNPQTVLPPLDRAVTLFSLIWIAWLWTFPEPAHTADNAMVLLNLFVLACLGVSLIAWAQGNLAGLVSMVGVDYFWQFLSLAFILLGIIVLVIRQPNGWGNGLAMLILAFIGHLATVIIPTGGDFPGAVRLTQIAMFPLLLTLPQRFPLQVAEIPAPPDKTKEVKTEKGVSRPAERRRYSIDPKTFHALLSLAAEQGIENMGNALTHGIAQATLADLCFLVTPTEDKNLAITCGYDLIREENLGGIAISSEAVPLLANAIRRGRPLRLPASSTSSDLKGLGQILGLSNPGHLLSVPVASRETGPMGAMLLLSPYSNRLWNAEDQTFLTTVSTLFIPILERGKRATLLEQERDEAREIAKEAAERVATAQKKVEELTQQYDSVREQASQAQLQAENSAALAATQEESQKLIEQLKAENEGLRKSPAAGAADTTKAAGELRMALEETAFLQNALADSNMKIMELEKQIASPITSDQAEVVSSISQELRQPMSSIVGYTDLLLGESVGILGALQRKFLERIKASTERIGGLVEDLIQITTLDFGHVEIKPEPVDLNLIIDNAVAYTSTQIREKNITLRLDTPEIPPQIQADREALQQVLIHILQNAGAATPVEGTVTLRMQIQEQDRQDYLQIQVTDTGGGIPTEDLPRVFQRRYRADHTLIQGLGDTSVGLSIAKSLVDAQNGRIWVDTKPGVGSTFSVLLPITSIEVPEEK